jgi:hypothetical protein
MDLDFRFVKSPKSFDFVLLSAIWNPSAASPRLSNSRMAAARLGICRAKRQSSMAACSPAVSIICKRSTRPKLMSNLQVRSARIPRTLKQAKPAKTAKPYKEVLTHKRHVTTQVPTLSSALFNRRLSKRRVAWTWPCLPAETRDFRRGPALKIELKRLDGLVLDEALPRAKLLVQAGERRPLAEEAC